jgi:hypothetical protein
MPVANLIHTDVNTKTFTPIINIHRILKIMHIVYTETVNTGSVGGIIVENCGIGNTRNPLTPQQMA